MMGRATRPLSSKIPSLARRAGVCGFMVTRGGNTSPKRERGDPGRELHPGIVEKQTTPIGGRATQARRAARLVEHEEHGLPADGKTVAPWIEQYLGLNRRRPSHEGACHTTVEFEDSLAGASGWCLWFYGYVGSV